MMKILRQHLDEVGETYFGHMLTALWISTRMQISAYAQLVHAVFPFIRPPLGGDVDSMKEFLENIRRKK